MQKFTALLSIAVYLIIKWDVNTVLFLLMFGNGNGFNKKFLLGAMILYFCPVIWIIVINCEKLIKKHENKEIATKKKRYAILQNVKAFLFFLIEEQLY